MADNVTLGVDNNATPPDATKIATDDIGGIQYQRMKLTLGADGAADMDLDSGQQTMANSVPVVIASDQSALPTSVATTPTIFNVTMTNPDTEYSQALPANTKRFSLQCLTDFDVRFAFAAGKVAGPAAPYALVRAGMNYYEEQVSLAAVTLYLASPDAGKIAEIIVWT